MRTDATAIPGWNLVTEQDLKRSHLWQTFGGIIYAPVPSRLQLSRRKGSDLQAQSRRLNNLRAVNCSRPSLFGNPLTLRNAIEAGYLTRASTPAECHTFLAQAFEDWLLRNTRRDWWQGPEASARRTAILNALDAGQLLNANLACFCAPDLRCHTDTLLRLANQ